MNTNVCHGSACIRCDRGSGCWGDYSGCGGGYNGGNGRGSGGSVHNMNTSVSVGGDGGGQGGCDSVGGGGGGRICGGGIDFWHTSSSWGGDGIEIDLQFIQIYEVIWFKWGKRYWTIFLVKSKIVKVKWCGSLR